MEAGMAEAPAVVQARAMRAVEMGRRGVPSECALEVGAAVSVIGCRGEGSTGRKGVAGLGNGDPRSEAIGMGGSERGVGQMSLEFRAEGHFGESSAPRWALWGKRKSPKRSLDTEGKGPRHEPGAASLRVGFLRLGPVPGESLLRGAVLHVVRCIAASLPSTRQMPVVAAWCDSKKCLQTLPGVPCRGRGKNQSQ